MFYPNGDFDKKAYPIWSTACGAFDDKTKI